MNAFKEEPMSPPVLALPNLTGHTTMDINACTVQEVCALLKQQEEVSYKPLGYSSR